MSREDLKEELDELLASNTAEELEKRFFKNYGCINFQTDEFYHELALAHAFHTMMAAACPEKHKTTESEPMHCYHAIECTCGFKEAYDSSD